VQIWNIVKRIKYRNSRITACYQHLFDEEASGFFGINGTCKERYIVYIDIFHNTIPKSAMVEKFYFKHYTIGMILT
jgi:hypothetical protein